MQQLLHAGVKLNYPLLSDITKGISAEYEVSQPHTAACPSCMSDGKASAAASIPRCPVPARVSTQGYPATPSLSCSCRCSSRSALAAVLSFPFLVCTAPTGCCCVPFSEGASAKNAALPLFYAVAPLLPLAITALCLRSLPAAGAD